MKKMGHYFNHKPPHSNDVEAHKFLGIDWFIGGNFFPRVPLVAHLDLVDIADGLIYGAHIQLRKLKGRNCLIW